MRIKPLTQRVIYENNPLAEVVCQVRFAPIEIGPEQVEKLWGGLDKSVYPLRFDEDVSTVELRFGSPDSKPESSETVQKIYNFISKDRAWKATVTRDFVALSCLKYETWNIFSERLNLALARVLEVFGSLNVIRVGLRYRDIIDRARLGIEDAPWIDLLQPIVLGPFAAQELCADNYTFDEKDVIAHTFQSVLNLETCQVLLQSGLVYSQVDHKQAFMIDTDFFREDSEIQDSMRQLSDLDSLLQQLHKDAGAMFRALITEKLHDALRPNPA